MTDLLSKERLEVLRDTFIDMASETTDKLEYEGWSDAAKAIDKTLQRREAEEKPVGEVLRWRNEDKPWLLEDDIDAQIFSALPHKTKLYAAPPLPVVPDDCTDAIYEMCCQMFDDPNSKTTEIWNACRAAMLQSGNSPVIPEGWALVPIEPTEDMVIDGFESRPDEFFSSQEDWAAYKAMSGCKQAAHRARLCWAAMIAAAPQPGKDGA